MKAVKILSILILMSTLLAGCAKESAPQESPPASATQPDREYDFGKSYWNDSIGDLTSDNREDYIEVRREDELFGLSVVETYIYSPNEAGKYVLTGGMYMVAGDDAESGEESFQHLLAELIKKYGAPPRETYIDADRNVYSSFDEMWRAFDDGDIKGRAMVSWNLYDPDTTFAMWAEFGESDEIALSPNRPQ